MAAALRCAHQLPALVAATEIGKTVSITVQRAGKEKTLSVTVGEMPAGPNQQQEFVVRRLHGGFVVADIAHGLAVHFRDDVADLQPAPAAGLSAVIPVITTPVVSSRSNCCWRSGVMSDT
jgi:hypothetical protein